MVFPSYHSGAKSLVLTIDVDLAAWDQILVHKFHGIGRTGAYRIAIVMLFRSEISSPILQSTLQIETGHKPTAWYVYTNSGDFGGTVDVSNIPSVEHLG